VNEEAAHPRYRLDEIIHSPVRLSVVAILAAAGETDFRFLRNTVQVSDSLLSKHLSTLEAAGYLKVVKGYVGKRPSTWYSLTDLGWQQFSQYKEALGLILGDEAASGPGPAVRPPAARPPGG
jgi:DNA-binding HxlR family transcriptional regulator